MTENLKAVRLNTQLLLLATTALLIFLMSPSDAKRLSGAMRDLESLREFLTRRPPQPRWKSPESPATLLLSDVRKANQAFGKLFPGNAKLDVASVLLDETPFVTLADWTPDVPISKTYYALKSVAGTQILQYDKVRIADLIEKGEALLGLPAVGEEATAEERQIAEDANLRWTRLDISATSRSTLYFEVIGGDMDADSIDLGTVEGVPVKGFDKELSRAHLIDERGVLTPDLAAFIPDLRLATLDEAILYLQLRREQDRSTVDILGLKAQSQTLVVVGPMVIAALLLHLCIHLRFLAHSSAPLLTTSNAWELQGIWMGSFPSKDAFALTLAILWMPISVAGILLQASMKSLDRTAIAGAFCLACAALCAILCTIDLHAYRAKLRAERDKARLNSIVD